MIRKTIFIFCLLLTAMALTPSQGQCENWKEFFRVGDTIWQYDKDSINYPEQKKYIFGFALRNKEIINVLTRNTTLKNYPSLVRIYCTERKCVGCEKDRIYNPFDKGPSGDLEPIEPGSWGESLLKKVCPWF